MFVRLALEPGVSSASMLLAHSLKTQIC